jgi:ParB/RepB/Spo0J family partition protein
MAAHRHSKPKPISGPVVVEQEMMGLTIAGIAIHPAARLFEMMPDDQLDELAADIKQRGLQQPLLFLKGRDGRYSLLDGRNRLRAHELLGEVKRTSDGLPQIAYEIVETEDPIASVLSHNLHRRHLSSEERAKLVRKVAAEHPEYSVRRLAEVTGASRSAVHRVIQEEPVKPVVEPESVKDPEPVMPAAADEIEGAPDAKPSADEASPSVPSGTPVPQPKPEPVPQPNPELKRVIGKDGRSYKKKQPAKSKATNQTPANTGKPLIRDRVVMLIGSELTRKPRETIEDFINLMRDARGPVLKLSESVRFETVMKFAAALGFDSDDLRLHLQEKAA